MESNIPKCRRKGDPATCQKIWDAIKHLRHDRKSVTSENIIRFVNKNYNVSERYVEREIPRLVEDGLIIEKKAVTTKGANKGSEQTVYLIPARNEINLKTKHDWYCFKCHKAGEVVLCNSCPRVYHVSCLEKTESWDTFVCKACHDSKTQNETNELEQREINYVLSFVVARLEDNFPADFYSWNPSLTSAIYATTFSTDRCASLAQKKQLENTEHSDTSDTWRADYLLHQEANLGKMNSRTDRQVYKNFEHFRLDARTIVHNVSVFHGEHSPTADTARLLLKRCLKELEDAKLCTDCYIRCNEQENDDWFCEPCDPPHQLVYAKAKGYPFWPAKVMSIVNDKYDVRFFGGLHDRSKIDKTHVRPIDSNISELVTKRSTAWKEAMKELEKHKKKLAEQALDDEEDDAVEANPSHEESSAFASGGPVPDEKTAVTLKGCIVTVKRNTGIDQLAKRATAIPEEELVKNPTKSRSKPVLQSSLDQFCRDELRSTMETVEQLQKEIALLKETHSQEIADLKEEVTKLASERDLALADARIQEEQNKIIKQEYEENIKFTEKKYQEQLEILRLENNRGDIQPLEKNYDEKMAKMRMEYEERIQGIEANRQEQNKVLERESEKRIHNLVDDLKKEYEMKIEALKKESDEEIKSLEAVHQNKIDSIKKESKITMETSIEEIKQDYKHQLQTLIQSHEEKLRLVKEDCQREIQANKKKQWCAQCSKEGAYHCCLGVSYCSTTCQHEHWNTTHKRTCVRKKEKH